MMVMGHGMEFWAGIEVGVATSVLRWKTGTDGRNWIDSQEGQQADILIYIGDGR
jgi:hypothetical protein